jgi:hypothetical protein
MMAVFRNQIMGFYMFGGNDQTGQVTNELHCLEFDRTANKECIDEMGNYKQNKVASCRMIAKKVITKGIGPIPRSQHSASFYNSYLIIYGGRNDTQYTKDLQAVALNDLHLLNTRSNTWVTLALFGEELPAARWGHQMSINDEGKLLIFGGLN